MGEKKKKKKKKKKCVRAKVKAGARAGAIGRAQKTPLLRGHQRGGDAPLAAAPPDSCMTAPAAPLAQALPSGPL